MVEGLELESYPRYVRSLHLRIEVNPVHIVRGVVSSVVKGERLLFVRHWCSGSRKVVRPKGSDKIGSELLDEADAVCSKCTEREGNYTPKIDYSKPLECYLCKKTQEPDRFVETGGRRCADCRLVEGRNSKPKSTRSPDEIMRSKVAFAFRKRQPAKHTPEVVEDDKLVKKLLKRR